MRVVLNEPPHAREARERTRCLVSVNDTELSHTDRQLLVATITGVEDEAVSRAVHRLECPCLLLDIEGKHVILVVRPVTGGLPELRVVHVRGNN